MKRIAAPSLLLTLLLATCAPQRLAHRPDLTLMGLAAEHTQRTPVFADYHRGHGARWNQAWPWQLDLTGIAWSQPKTTTAITPRHVVMADHYRLKPGETTVFHDRDGHAHSRKVINVIRLRDLGAASDVAVGLLDLPLPASIRSYPLPRLQGDPNVLTGATAVVTGARRAIDFREIGGFHGSGMHFRYLDHQARNRDHALITGDSGNPSFLLSHGELILIETHTTGGPGGGPFYGAPEIQQALQRAVKMTDPKQAIQFVPLDARTLREAAGARAALDRAQGAGATVPVP